MANKLPYMVDETSYRRKQHVRMEMEVYSKQAQALIKGLMEMAISRFNVDPPLITVMNNYRIARKNIAHVLTNKFKKDFDYRLLVDFRVEAGGDHAEIVIRFWVLNNDERSATPYNITLKKVMPVAPSKDPFKRRLHRQRRVTMGNGHTVYSP